MGLIISPLAGIDNTEPWRWSGRLETRGLIVWWKFWWEVWTSMIRFLFHCRYSFVKSLKRYSARVSKRVCCDCDWTIRQHEALEETQPAAVGKLFIDSLSWKNEGYMKGKPNYEKLGESVCRGKKARREVSRGEGEEWGGWERWCLFTVNSQHETGQDT